MVGMQQVSRTAPADQIHEPVDREGSVSAAGSSWPGALTQKPLPWRREPVMPFPVMFSASL